MFEDSWNAEIQRHRPPHTYRGMADARHQLKTSLMRLGRDYDKVEKHLLRNFRRYAHRNAVEFDSIWHWLSLAAHHGLPTRLLDWTNSPLIAAHFATCDIEKFDRDGAIWCVNFVNVNQLLPQKLKSLLAEESALQITVEMLSKAARSLKEFDALAGDDYVVFFDPPSLDDRIVNQYALFSVLSNPKGLLDDWLNRRPTLYRKIIIPASLKWEIRDKLDKSNINERMLFPGLDGLASWLKRYYSAPEIYL